MRSPDAPAHLSSQPVIRAWLARSCNVHRVESTHTRVRGTRAFFLLPFPAFFAFLLAIMLGCGIARAIRMRNEREQWWRWRKPTLARVALPCIYSDGSMSGRWRRERREKDSTVSLKRNETARKWTFVGWMALWITAKAANRGISWSNDSLHVLTERIFASVSTLLQTESII